MFRALLTLLVTVTLSRCEETTFVSDWKELQTIVDYIPSADLDVMDEWDRIDHEIRALSQKEVERLKKTLQQDFPKEMRVVDNAKDARSLAEARTVLDAFLLMKPSIDRALKSIKQDRNRRKPDLWTMIIRGVVSIVA